MEDAYSSHNHTYYTWNNAEVADIGEFQPLLYYFTQMHIILSQVNGNE